MFLVLAPVLASRTAARHALRALHPARGLKLLLRPYAERGRRAPCHPGGTAIARRARHARPSGTSRRWRSCCSFALCVRLARAERLLPRARGARAAALRGARRDGDGALRVRLHDHRAGAPVGVRPVQRRSARLGEPARLLALPAGRSRSATDQYEGYPYLGLGGHRCSSRPRPSARSPRAARRVARARRARRSRRPSSRPRLLYVFALSSVDPRPRPHGARPARGSTRRSTGSPARTARPGASRGRSTTSSSRSQSSALPRLLGGARRATAIARRRPRAAARRRERRRRGERIRDEAWRLRAPRVGGSWPASTGTSRSCRRKSSASAAPAKSRRCTATTTASGRRSRTRRTRRASRSTALSSPAGRPGGWSPPAGRSSTSSARGELRDDTVYVVERRPSRRRSRATRRGDVPGTSTASASASRRGAATALGSGARRRYPIIRSGFARGAGAAGRRREAGVASRATTLPTRS